MKFWILWRRKTGEPREKCSEQGEKQHQTQPTYGAVPEMDTGPYWWKASAATTAPPLLLEVGLIIVIILVILAESCGGVLTDPYGEITSPNYPNNYPDDVTCTWKISPEKTHVNLTIEDFMVSAHVKKRGLLLLSVVSAVPYLGGEKI